MPDGGASVGMGAEAELAEADKCDLGAGDLAKAFLAGALLAVAAGALELPSMSTSTADADALAEAALAEALSLDLLRTGLLGGVRSDALAEAEPLVEALSAKALSRTSSSRPRTSPAALARRRVTPGRTSADANFAVRTSTRSAGGLVRERSRA